MFSFYNLKKVENVYVQINDAKEEKKYTKTYVNDPVRNAAATTNPDLKYLG